MKVLVYSIIGLFAVTACQKEIPLPESETNPRVVVNCLFESDSTWLINLSESRPILATGDLPYISNGSIKLYNESETEIGSFIYDTDGNYRLNTPLPSAGSAYSIKVDVPGYETVSANSYAPNEVDIVSIDTASKMADQIMNYTINIQDEPDVKNYYSLIITSGSYWVDFETLDTNYYEYSGMGTFEPFVTNGYSDIATNEKYAEEFLFTDEFFDGDLISFKAQTYLLQSDYPGYYKIVVKSLSEDAYKYNLTLSKYHEADGDFFAEPVQVISNIENGLGIFGGISIYTDTLWIE